MTKERKDRIGVWIVAIVFWGGMFVVGGYFAFRDFTRGDLVRSAVGLAVMGAVVGVFMVGYNTGKTHQRDGKKIDW